MSRVLKIAKTVYLGEQAMEESLFRTACVNTFAQNKASAEVVRVIKPVITAMIVEIKVLLILKRIQKDMILIAQEKETIKSPWITVEEMVVPSHPSTRKKTSLRYGIKSDVQPTLELAQMAKVIGPMLTVVNGGSTLETMDLVVQKKQKLPGTPMENGTIGGLEMRNSASSVNAKMHDTIKVQRVIFLKRQLKQMISLKVSQVVLKIGCVLI